jgi:hypothetical protein
MIAGFHKSEAHVGVVFGIRHQVLVDVVQVLDVRVVLACRLQKCIGRVLPTLYGVGDRFDGVDLGPA